MLKRRRTFKSYEAGGYVVVIEKKEDFKEIKNKTYIDCANIIAEYIDSMQ